MSRLWDIPHKSWHEQKLQQKTICGTKEEKTLLKPKIYMMHSNYKKYKSYNLLAKMEKFSKFTC